MKQTIFALTVLLIGNFQNAMAMEPLEKTEKKQEVCQQLKDCKAAWQKTLHSTDTIQLSECVDACKAVRGKCSTEKVSTAEAHRLSCKNSLNKLQQKKENMRK